MRPAQRLASFTCGLLGLTVTSACSTGPAGVGTANVVLSTDEAVTASLAPTGELSLSLGDVPSDALASLTLNVIRIDVHVAASGDAASEESGTEGTGEGSEDSSGEGADGADGSGWITLDLVLTGPVDLLDLAGTAGVDLAGGSIPAGKITQVRLFFDVAELTTDAPIDVPGQTLAPGVYEVTVPSAQNTGLKIQTQKDVGDGEIETVEVEFSLDASIGTLNWNANGFRLSPVMRVK